MSDFEIDWDLEDGLAVEHDGGVDLVATDHQLEDHNDDFHGTDEAVDVTDSYTFAEVSDESEYVDPTDLPDWQLDADFGDGSYDLMGADPGEDDLWSQLMVDMNGDVNPYAAN